MIVGIRFMGVQWYQVIGMGVYQVPIFGGVWRRSRQTPPKKDLRGRLRRIGIRLSLKVAPASSRSAAHRDRLEAGATLCGIP